LLVDAAGAGQMALGQSADGDEAAHDGPWLLLALGDRLAQSLVTVRGSLDWVVAVAGQHTLLERSDDALGLAGRADIICRNRLDTRLARLPDI